MPKKIIFNKKSNKVFSACLQRKKRATYLALLLAYFFNCTRQLIAYDLLWKQSDLVVNMGSVQTQGVFADYYQGRQYVSLGLGLPFKRYLEYSLSWNNSIAWSAWKHQYNRRVALSAWSIQTGLELLYNHSHYLSPYIGGGLSINRFHYQGSVATASEKMARLGFYSELGNRFAISWGVSLQAGAQILDYGFSGQRFNSINYLVAIRLNYDDYQRQKTRRDLTQLENKRLKNIEDMTQTMKKLYDNNDLLLAEKSCQQLLLLDPENLEASQYLMLIEAKKKYIIALKDIKNNREYAAISSLQLLRKNLPEAEETLLTLRADLKPRIAPLFAYGQKAYAEEKYDESIVAMEKIMLIQPDHREAKIYRNRSIKKRQALINLR